MEHIAALLLVIGCSNDLSACQEIAVDVPVFETRQACSRELVSAQRSLGREYPTVFFQCIAVDPALEHEDAELVWDVDSAGTLHAAVETRDPYGVPEMVVALNETDREHN